MGKIAGGQMSVYLQFPGHADVSMALYDILKRLVADGFTIDNIGYDTVSEWDTTAPFTSTYGDDPDGFLNTVRRYFIESATISLNSPEGRIGIFLYIAVSNLVQFMYEPKLQRYIHDFFTARLPYACTMDPKTHDYIAKFSPEK